MDVEQNFSGDNSCTYLNTNISSCLLNTYFVCKIYFNKVMF